MNDEINYSGQNENFYTNYSLSIKNYYFSKPTS